MLHNTHFLMRIRRKLAACMTMVILFTTLFASSGTAFAEMGNGAEQETETSISGSDVEPKPDVTDGGAVSGGDVSGELPDITAGDVSGNEEEVTAGDVSEGDLSAGDVSNGNLVVSSGDLFPLTLSDGTVLYPAELYKNGEMVEKVMVLEKDENVATCSPEEAFEMATASFAADRLISLQSLRDGRNITVERGTQYYYKDYGFPNSNWSTHYYRVSSEGSSSVAYCVEPAEAAGGGSGLSGTKRNDLTLLKKVLFYGFGGGEDCSSSIIGGDTGQRYIWTHILAAYCYRDDDNDYLHGLGISSIEESPALTNAIQAFDSKKLASAEVSKASIEGDLTEVKNTTYLITEKVTLSGDLDLRDYPGLEMIKVSNGSTYGNTKVSMDGTKVYFRRKLTDTTPTQEEITLQGRAVDAWIVKSSGKQDMAYMTFDENRASMTITWNAMPTERGAELYIHKHGESLNSVTKNSASGEDLSTLLYQFHYTDTGLGAVTFELYVEEDFTGLDGKHYKAGQLFATETTDADGEVIFVNVQFSDDEANQNAAKYYLKEIQSAPGYYGDEEKIYHLVLKWDKGPKWTGDGMTNNETMRTSLNLNTIHKITDISASKIGKSTSRQVFYGIIKCLNLDTGDTVARTPPGTGAYSLYISARWESKKRCVRTGQF